MGAVGIVLKDELLETVSNSPHVHFIFAWNLNGGFLQFLAVAGGFYELDILLDLCDRLPLSDIQVNELVGDDTQLLEGKGLNFGAGESLDDPGLMSLLDLVYFCFDEPDHDFIVDWFNITVYFLPNL